METSTKSASVCRPVTKKKITASGLWFYMLLSGCSLSDACPIYRDWRRGGGEEALFYKSLNSMAAGLPSDALLSGISPYSSAGR